AGTASQASAQWTVISLHPAGASQSRALGVENGQQVGYLQIAFGDFDAVTWSGSADTVAMLDPSPDGDARATCVQGSNQFGSSWVFDAGEAQWHTHAAMWSGTAASFVDLHPQEIGAVHSRVTSAHGTTLGGSWF